jgi:hypothetical protein
VERQLAETLAIEDEKIIVDQARVPTNLPRAQGVEVWATVFEQAAASPSRMTLSTGRRAIAAPINGKSPAQLRPLRDHKCTTRLSRRAMILSPSNFIS